MSEITKRTIRDEDEDRGSFKKDEAWQEFNGLNL